MTGCGPASLCRVRQRRQRAAYTLCPDNGGNSGISYLVERETLALASLLGRSLCSSEVHSAPVCGRGSHLSPLSGPSAQRLLVLFTAIRVIVFSWRSLYQTFGRLSNREQRTGAFHVGGRVSLRAPFAKQSRAHEGDCFAEGAAPRNDCPRNETHPQRTRYESLTNSESGLNHGVVRCARDVKQNPDR
jgi:hypothetical protein